MQVTRRQWLRTTSALVLGASLLPAWAARAPARAYRYLKAEVAGPPGEVPFYIPFGWKAVLIPPQAGALKLNWKKSAKGSDLRLRITSATDGREACVITVKTAQSGATVGHFDIRFATYLQPFEIPVPAESVAAVLREGVVLHQSTGQKPFAIFISGGKGSSAPTAFLPHLLVPGPDPEAKAWKKRLLSLESLQTFGWMYGCVLDGIHELAQDSQLAQQALQEHLAMYFGQDSLEYADLDNRIARNKVNTVESLLPFAILAQHQPDHPLLNLAIDFSTSHADEKGVVADGALGNRPIKTEECYTVCYPLAVMARLLNRPELAVLSINSLKARVEGLDRQGIIYQRKMEQGEPIYGNWGRGIVWYLLGMAKTLHHLPQDAQTQPLRATLQAAVEPVLHQQQPNGLWYCFTDQPETGFETSGSAGIAAALAYGHRHGLLPDLVLPHLEKARQGLRAYLTPDGYLTGTAQANKGGLALQTGGYRVISPYTLGFLAHFDG